MKKLFYAATLCLSVFFVSSCDSDDDNGSSTNTIVGNWEIFEINFFISSDEGTLDETFPTDVCNMPFIISFTEDGGAILPDGDIGLNFEGNPSLNCSLNGSDINGTWQLVSGNDYILIQEGDVSNAEINVSNSNNTIEIIIDGSDPDDSDPTTQIITFRGNRN